MATATAAVVRTLRCMVADPTFRARTTPESDAKLSSNGQALLHEGPQRGPIAVLRDLYLVLSLDERTLVVDVQTVRLERETAGHDRLRHRHGIVDEDALLAVGVVLVLV